VPNRLTKEILDAITDKAEEGLDGPQIQKHLEALYKEGRDGFDTIPHLRTIQSKMKPAKGEDSSGHWRLLDASPDDAAVILRVLADVVYHTRNRRRYLTNREAEVVLKLRQALSHSPTAKLQVQDVTGFDAFKLAREYIRREERGEATEDLDLIVAYAVIGFSPGQMYEGITGTAPPHVLLTSDQDYMKTMEGESDARTHTKTG
jgi:hypothetical protein